MGYEVDRMILEGPSAGIPHGGAHLGNRTGIREELRHTLHHERQPVHRITRDSVARITE